MNLNLQSVISQLLDERTKIDRALAVLVPLNSTGKRRGRPPKNPLAGLAIPKRRGRPPGSKNKPK